MEFMAYIWDVLNKNIHMPENKSEEDQFRTDKQVLGPGEENRDMRDNPVADDSRDRNHDTSALYLTSDSTMQSPEEHAKDQKKDPRKEEETITGTPALDETGPYDDRGEAGV